MNVKNEKVLEEKKVYTVELDELELAQISLSLTCRMGFAQQKWACAINAEEQTGAANLINYIANLNTKVQEILNNSVDTNKKN